MTTAPCKAPTPATHAFLLVLFIEGEPKPQPRARAFSRGGSARVYDPATAEGWKSLIAQAVRDKVPTAPLVGRVDLRLAFAFERPKSHYRKSGALRDSAPAHHVQRPDIDNLAKAVLDALTTLGLWADDTQVARIDAAKFWALAGHKAGMAIKVKGQVNP